MAVGAAAVRADRHASNRTSVQLTLDKCPNQYETGQANYCPRSVSGVGFYRPLDTGLVVTARAAGCAVADGSGMLVAQAAGTFKHITGVAPELARMCRHLAELVAPAAGVSSRGG
jgi:shikimate 5-dehydrogenase